MAHHLHLERSAELLRAILVGAAPADAAHGRANVGRSQHPASRDADTSLDGVGSRTLAATKHMENYFRAHREMGVRDRGEVAETVYACLRHKRLFEHVAESSDPAHLVAAYWLRQGISARALEDAGFPGDARALAARLRTLDVAALPFAVRASLPDWLADRLLAHYGASEAILLADALNAPAPVDLRANTLKATTDEVRARLFDEGYACDPTPYAPTGLRLRSRGSVFRTAAFNAGCFEVQDEASQIVSLLLEPRRGEMVVDFCAGAGGKTLHLGALMANTGTLYAFDVSDTRLQRLAPRARRAGLSNVRTVTIAHERDARVQRLYGKIDRVLVDAPCSGTGTLRRNPDIKWRAIDLPALTQAQRRILDGAAPLLKPGGRLVYATCSLLVEESEAMVAEFCTAHPEFGIVDANEILARRHVALDAAADGTLRLAPHRHGTDGFYVASLVRRQPPGKF